MTTSPCQSHAQGRRPQPSKLVRGGRRPLGWSAPVLLLPAGRHGTWHWDKGESLTVDGETMKFSYDDVLTTPLRNGCRCTEQPLRP